jgi:hypothetical protein
MANDLKNCPVMVEWYVHTFIPSVRHVVIVDYGTAKRWAEKYDFVQIHLIDPSLYSDMVAKR